MTTHELANKLYSKAVYQEFLHRKAQISTRDGFAPTWMPPAMFDFQQSITEWNLWQGRSADLLNCGLGKTVISSTWAENILRHTNEPVLILTPLAVAQQFVTEGEKFGIEVNRIHKGSPQKPGIYVTNYEKLHLFDPNDWVGIVADESGCLKAMNGKRRAEVTEFMRTLRYRLMATATPAPNDYIELGTISEALGVMGQVDMLNRFFKNDQNTSDTRRRWSVYATPQELKSPGWRFKGHAEIPFWRFVNSFSRSARKPSDLGPFSDHRYILPPLIEREHLVETRTLANGYLLPMPATNRREELEERRRTIQERCEMAASLVCDTGKPFIAWCQLNDEGDLLERLIPDAVQISGQDSDELKEEKYQQFLSGQMRGMISKHIISGYGINCQHCPHVVEFEDHSWERHYQGVRRCWRFGQTQIVINDIIGTQGQQGARESRQRKSAQSERMFESLVSSMLEAQHIDGGYKFTQDTKVPNWLL